MANYNPMQQFQGAPPDIEQGAMDLFQRQQLAQMLMQRGLEPMGDTQYTHSGGGQWAAPPQAIKQGWGQGLAKLGQVAAGAYMNKIAGDEQKALAEQLKTRRGDALQDVLSAQGSPAMPQAQMGPPTEDGQYGVQEAKPAVSQQQAMAKALIGSEFGDFQDAGMKLALQPPKAPNWQSMKTFDTNGREVTQIYDANSATAPTPTTVGSGKAPTPMFKTVGAEGDKEQQMVSTDGGQTWVPEGVPTSKFAPRAVTNVNTPPMPITTTDAAGNTKLWNRNGSLIADLGKSGKPTATFEKTVNEKKALSKNINEAIAELEKATTVNGLIEKSTGSGAGSMVDSVAGFFGKATPGAIASGQMQPIFDLVLKMVPRFEGPQSDKDTASYKEAAGQLANPAIPNPQKLAAGKEILRLMKARKNQFESVGTDSSGIDSLLEKYK